MVVFRSERKQPGLCAFSKRTDIFPSLSSTVDQESDFGRLPPATAQNL